MIAADALPLALTADAPEPTLNRAERRRAAKEAEAAGRIALKALYEALTGPSPHPEGTPLVARLTHLEVATIARALPLLPPDLKREIAAMVAHIPEAPPAIPLHDFIAKAKPDYRWYWYGEVMAERGMDIIEGRLRRLMVFAPPRAGKSEFWSRLFTAYYNYRFPMRWVGLASYADDLAFGLARSSRANYLAAGGRMDSLRDATAVQTMANAGKGGMWAAGVGGPITGKGFHLGVIDDPLKNSEQASSLVIRAKHKEWWQGTWYTRREPNAAIVIVMTPWHEDDLANWLLRRETAAQPQAWHIIAIDAIRKPRQRFFVPGTCTLEPDPRKEGESFNPERAPLADLLSTRATVSSYYWSAMFQARPKPKEGNLFKRKWFTPLRALPTNIIAAVRYWDLASTDKAETSEHDPDYTRSCLMLKYRTPLASDTGGTGNWITRFCIAHASGGQMAPLGRDDHIVAMAQRDEALFGRLGFHIWIENDSGGGGKERTQAIIGKLAGYRASAEPPLGQSKELRADPFRAQAEARNVDYCDPAYEWSAEFFDELCGFPFAAHDDYFDAASGAFAKVSAAQSMDAVPEIIPQQASAPLAGIHNHYGDAIGDAIGSRGGIFGDSVGIIGG